MNGIASPWFDGAEYADRLARLQSGLAERGLDGLIAFQPETVTWLTGFFTRGYSSFQCAIVPVEGSPAIVCRDVEEFYVDPAHFPTALSGATVTTRLLSRRRRSKGGSAHRPAWESSCRHGRCRLAGMLPCAGTYRRLHGRTKVDSRRTCG